MSSIVTDRPKSTVLEIEVKIRIADPETTRIKLEKAGAALHRDRHLEENVLYDLPDKSLFNRQSALRLRTSGKRSFLTFKGPTQKSRKFKIREEFESEVKDPKQLSKILRSLGYREVFRYRKFREVFRTKKISICLDETEAGNFIELEGDRSDIVRFSRSLGFSKDDFIKTDYIRMLSGQGRVTPDRKVKPDYLFFSLLGGGRCRFRLLFLGGFLFDLQCQFLGCLRLFCFFRFRRSFLGDLFLRSFFAAGNRGRDLLSDKHIIPCVREFLHRILDDLELYEPPLDFLLSYPDQVPGFGLDLGLGPLQELLCSFGCKYDIPELAVYFAVLFQLNTAPRA
jgi:adenylate cyclase class 2